jgi:Protein of unknown function (DUF2934)
MAKMKTGARAATPGDRATKVQTDRAVSERDIARHAYDLFVARGREHGHDVEDWIQAERALRTTEQSTAA